jgi:hypothetical protein
LEIDKSGLLLVARRGERWGVATANGGVDAVDNNSRLLMMLLLLLLRK